jgi:glycerate kinase
MTADAGWGLAHTLGLRALDAHGNVVEPALANVPLIDHFVAQDVPEFFRKTRIVALCDVNAPAQGAAVSLASFLPQKGASPADADLIQKQVTTLWTHLRKVNPQLSSLEDAYTGAGGGLVLGLQAVFPQLRLELGARKVAQATALGPSLQAADFAVCGEGRFDDSTFYGKAAAVVSQLGSEHQARIVGVFGSIAMQGAAREGARTRLGAETLHALFDEGQAHLSLQELSKASRARFVEIGLRIAHDAECASR